MDAGRGLSGRSPDGVSRDAAYTVLTRLALAGLILATDVVLARVLGPAPKGSFALILLFSQLGALVLGLGMDKALGVIAGRSREDARRGFANALLWTLLAGGFGVVAVLALYHGANGPAAADPAGPLAALLPNVSGNQFLFGALALPAEMFFAIGLLGLLGRRRVGAYNTIRLLRRAVLLLLFVAVAAVARLSLDAALLINLLSLGVAALAVLVVASREQVLAVEPNAVLLGEQVRFGLRSVFGTLAERLQFRADAFLVNLLLGLTATGVYSVAAGLAETLWYVPNALGVVMFSRAVSRGSDAAGVASALTRSTLALAVVLSVPVALLAPFLVETVYGSEFIAAAFALQALLPGVVAYSVVAILSQYVVGRGSPGAYTVVLLLGLATNLAANLVLIPALGIIGAAVASSLSYGLTALLTVAIFRRISGQGLRETLLLTRADLAAGAAAVVAVRARLLRTRPTSATSL